MRYQGNMLQDFMIMLINKTVDFYISIVLQLDNR